MSSKKDFLSIIKKQREKVKPKKFSGTFLEYLDVIGDDPKIAKHSHARLYDAIINHGVVELEDSDRKRKLFNNDYVRVYEYFDG